MADATTHKLGVGEEVVAVFSPARRSIVVRSLRRVLIAAVFIGVGLWASPWIVQSLSDVGVAGVRPRSWIMAIGLGSMLLKLTYESLLQASRTYTLSSTRMVATGGVFRRMSVEIPLDRVQQVVLDRTLLERFTGLGTLCVTSAGSQMIDLAWVMVKRPGERLAQVREALDRAAVRVHVVESPCVRLVAENVALAAREKLQKPDKERAQLGRLREARAVRSVATTGSSGDALTTGSLPSVKANGPMVVGLAGGIGSGKSEVAKVLASLGALVTDSDKDAKAALERSEVRAKLVEWWGAGVVSNDGSTNRKAIAQVVFERPEERARLEGLIHPLVKATRSELIGKATELGLPMVVIDAPLLFEAGLDAECDAVVFVEASRAERLARVKATRGWDEAELDRREKAQLPLETKKTKADVVIQNTGNLDDLRAQVDRAYRTLLARSDPGRVGGKGKP